MGEYADALVILDRTERALADASDWWDLIDVRADAKALQVMAMALNMGDAAQAAKVVQIKAERKAGAWLAEYVRPGRPGETCQPDRVFLEELEITASTSSRWQLLAEVPDDKFSGWIDERLASGAEITAGGLRNYARALKGQPQVGGRPSGAILLNPTDACALSGYMIRCDGPPTHEHIVRRGLGQGNDAVHHYLDAEENITYTCVAHNVGRYSDNYGARRIMVLQQIYKYGLDRIRSYYAGIPWKVPNDEYTIERMLA